MKIILVLLLLTLMEHIQHDVLVVISLLLFLYVTLKHVGMNYQILISQSLLQLNQYLKIVRLEVLYNKRELIIYQFIIVYSSI